MSGRAVDRLRWLIVWAYALLGSALMGGGMSAAEVVAMFVIGWCALVGILLAGWIAKGGGDADVLR